MKHKMVVLSLMALTALALSGCGGQERVKIAITFTEQLWVYGGLRDAAELALEEYHARGIGPEVELTTVAFGTNEDPVGAYDMAIEADAVQRAVDDPEVVVIVGGTGTGPIQVGLPIANRGGLAYIGGGGYWAGLTQPGYGPGEPGIYYPTGVRTFFRATTRDDVSMRSAADFIVEELGAETVYIVNSGDITSSVSFAGQFELAAGDAGMTVLAHEACDETTATQEEIEALAQRVVDAQPDVLYVAGMIRSNFLYYVRALDPEMVIFGTDLTYYEVNEPPEGHSVSELDGFYYQDQYPYPSQLDNDVARAFLSNYEPREELSPTWGGAVAMVYEMMRVALYAIERAEQPTREGVLESVQNLGTYSGVYGDWTFTPEGDMTVGFSVIRQFQSGGWQIVDFAILEQD